VGCDKKKFILFNSPFLREKRKKKYYFHICTQFHTKQKAGHDCNSLSLSLSLSLSKIIKLNSSSTFLGEELTQESAGMIGQKVQFLL
jgi:hypothetical protein